MGVDELVVRPPNWPNQPRPRALMVDMHAPLAVRMIESVLDLEVTLFRPDRAMRLYAAQRYLKEVAPDRRVA